MHRLLRNTCIYSLLLASQLLLAYRGVCQPESDPNNFYKNIVDLGNGEFGMVVGDDDKNCYFISIGNNDTALTHVSFYHGSFVGAASCVKEFYFGPYQVNLYRCERDPLNNWQKRYFGSMGLNMLMAKTFVSRGTTDSAWVMSEEKILLHEILPGGVVTMTVDEKLPVKRGMPLVSNTGFICGVFATDGNGKPVVAAINMRDIAEQIYNFSECRHFNMIAFKQHANRCVLEQFDTQVKPHKDSYQVPKKEYFVSFGLFGNVVAQTLEKTTDNTDQFSDGIRPLNYGASIYLNIDRKNRQRITMKISAGKYDEFRPSGFWKSADGKLKLTRSKYEIVNQTVVYERLFYRFKSFSGSVGLGYNLGLTDKQVFYISKTNGNDQSMKYPIDRTALVHRLVGELHFFEWKIFRLGAIFWQDVGKFPNAAYSFQLDGTSYKPLAQRKKPFYHGFEASIRFGGLWGLKIGKNDD